MCNLSAGKAMANDVNFTIRVPKELRDAFVSACTRTDRPASQVLRHFMRAFTEKHAQTDLEDLIRREARK